MKFQASEEWLRKMAEAEDGCNVNIGCAEQIVAEAIIKHLTEEVARLTQVLENVRKTLNYRSCHHGLETDMIDAALGPETRGTMTLERGKPSPMEYYHDIHCNADSFQPQGCCMCSCWQPRAEKAEAKLLALESALWKIIDDGNIESFAFKVAEEALSKNFHKEPRV